MYSFQGLIMDESSFLSKILDHFVKGITKSCHQYSWWHRILSPTVNNSKKRHVTLNRWIFIEGPNNTLYTRTLKNKTFWFLNRLNRKNINKLYSRGRPGTCSVHGYQAEKLDQRKLPIAIIKCFRICIYPRSLFQLKILLRIRYMGQLVFGPGLVLPWAWNEQDSLGDRFQQHLASYQANYLLDPERLPKRKLWK